MNTDSISFEEELASLGVTRQTLTASQKRHLDEQGYLAISDVISPAGAVCMREEMSRIFKEEKTLQPGGPLESGQLQSKSEAFDLCVTDPRVLAAAWHVLGYRQFISMGVHSRPNPPGKGLQALHVDYSGPPVAPGDYFYCNSIWPLTEFTIENGATRVIPGSHLWCRHPADFKNPEQAHPQQIQLAAPLGTVVIFNSHLWHSAMPNHSTADRPNVTSYFARRIGHEGKPVVNSLGEAAWNRLPRACRNLFDPPGGQQWLVG
jgi:ectoine hydroxylase-related dioxygenase (phytanoyl-CoA dioxygenase family)